MKSVNHWKDVTLLKEEVSKRYICHTFKTHATRKAKYESSKNMIFQASSKN